MSTFFEFEVELIDARPRVWRRFFLKETLTFKSLHNAIQTACGWYDSHLFEFLEGSSFGSNCIAISPHFEAFDDEYDPPKADKVKLKRYFRDHLSCVYKYDFGDGWLHEVKLLGTKELDVKKTRILIDGGRSFPPEDCGGMPGYENCVVAFRAVDPLDEEIRSTKDWIGNWNPDYFNLDEVKRGFDR